MTGGLSPTASVDSGAEHWLQEMFEPVADADQSADDRKQRKNHQRNQHHHWALVRFAVAVSIVAMRMRVLCP